MRSWRVCQKNMAKSRYTLAVDNMVTTTITQIAPGIQLQVREDSIAEDKENQACSDDDDDERTVKTSNKVCPCGTRFSCERQGEVESIAVVQVPRKSL